MWVKTHQPCPCGISSDSYSIDANGWGKCFTCYKNFKDKESKLEEEKPKPVEDKVPVVYPKAFREIGERGLSKETCEKYGIGSHNGTHLYPYFDVTRKVHVANKFRSVEAKGFAWKGSKDPCALFGAQSFEPGQAKTITITEGELDAAAVFEMNGGFPSVSVRSASQALTDCKNNYEYLNSFPEIVVAFDNDKPRIGPDGKVVNPGQDAAIACANLFPIGKVRILALKEGKDPCDYSSNGKTKEFRKEWWAAPRYTPAGLRLGKDMKEEVFNREQAFTVPYPFEGLQAMTYGMRLSEAVLLLADTGVGKTSVFKEIEYSLLTNKELIEKNMGVGFLHLEETNADTILGLVSIHDNKPYHLPDTERDLEQMYKSFDDLIDNDRVVVWDHFGANSVEEVLNKIRHMVAMGCKYIFIDHLSIIVSDQSGDERKQLDEISTKLKTLTMELDIAIMAVIHTNRQGEVRGSAGPEQLANIMVRLERDKKDIDPWRRNVTKVTIEKNRFCGRTGPCCWLYYDSSTGRLVELEPDEIKAFEEGGTLNEQINNWVE